MERYHDRIPRAQVLGQRGFFCSGQTVLLWPFSSFASADCNCFSSHVVGADRGKTCELPIYAQRVGSSIAITDNCPVQFVTRVNLHAPFGEHHDPKK